MFLFDTGCLAHVLQVMMALCHHHPKHKLYWVQAEQPSFYSCNDCETIFTIDNRLSSLENPAEKIK